ncbi:MAG: hypothetical protein KBS61_00130 [Chryseobacterium sp.]|nr:hypothetical protein [Candidatus Chryseobacterium enterohippi]
MSKENFSWKSLFITEKEEKEPTTSPTQNPIPPIPNQPQQNSQFPNTASQAAPISNTNNPFINDVLEVYEKGFESLNDEGFDFFELYKSVSVVGVNNPQSYQMAFAMGKSLRPDLSKQFLLDKSQHYITEIEKVFKNYDVIGNSKQSELNNGILKRKEELTKNINDIQTEIASLQNDLQKKNAELLQIDTDNKQQFVEIQQKIEANAIAKQRILESINTVINGINQYL